MPQAANDNAEWVKTEIRARVDRRSILFVAKELGISRDVVTRIYGGAPVRAGSLALVAEALRSAKTG